MARSGGEETSESPGAAKGPSPGARSVQTDVPEIEAVLSKILSLSVPPVARCRILSSGFSSTHMLNVRDPLDGTKACLGCGNCIDVCGLLSREPKRLERTAQRTSMALETIVGEDCDRCDNCLLACPQVDTTIKHYVVRSRIVEQMERLMALGSADETDWFDWYAESADAACGREAGE